MIRAIVLAFAASSLLAQKSENVLVIANQNSPVSKTIAEYYARKRSIPSGNIYYLKTAPTEIIERRTYDDEIAGPVAAFLKKNRLQEQILYIVTTLGVPLGIDGNGGVTSDQASVDSELTLLYSTMKGAKYELKGPFPNPLFAQRDAPFSHAAFPIYLVTRLAGYEFADVRGLIDRSLAAVNRGKVVVDLKSSEDAPGNDWLRTAAILMPTDRLILDETKTVLYGQKNVIGYASWGSNDPNRKERWLRNQWLPGAIMTEYVSTNGRTFERPPDSWNLSSWSSSDQPKWFKGSPQTLTADYVREGVTGASGHVFEPYLQYTPRPDKLFAAYISGRTLAESYYLALPALSWKNIVIGDPLCRLPR